MFGGLGWPELLVILVVVLLIFGPKNLPKLGKSLGKTVKNIREGMEGDSSSEKDAKKIEDKKVEVKEASDDDEDGDEVDDFFKEEK